MVQLRYFLKSEFLENSAQNYLIFVSAIIIGLLFKGLISRYLSHSLYKVIGKKEKRVGVEKFDKLLTRPIGFFIMLTILYFGASYLEFPKSWGLAKGKKGRRCSLLMNQNYMDNLLRYWRYEHFSK